MRRAPFAFLAALSFTACGDPPWVGKFAATSTWNISGPLADGRTVGDAVADVLVGQLVSVAPVPGPLEGSVHELVDSLLRVHVKGLVDANVPDTLKPTGALTQALAGSLGAVHVESTIDLEEATFDDMEGTETLELVTFDIAGSTHELDIVNLLGTSGAMRAEWGGDEGDDDTLEIEEHDVPLSFGALVLNMASKLVDAAELEDLQAGVTSAMNCGDIVDAVLGGDAGLTLSVSSWSHTIPASTFTGACDAVKSLAGEKALGVFALDAAVTIGGNVGFRERGDGAELTSKPGFGGIVNIAPEVIAPRLTVEMRATR
ncbi:MAG: hypothetical protein ACAI38_09990 [Myxococcota bacterium]